MSQVHFGYTGDHCSVRDKEGHARPTLMKNLDDLQRLAFSSSSKDASWLFDVRKIHSKWDYLSGNLFDDNEEGGFRLSCAKKIDPDNIGHARSLFGAYCETSLVSCHCDIGNDGTEQGIESNMNWTLIVHASYIDSSGRLLSIRDILYAKKD